MPKILKLVAVIGLSAALLITSVWAQNANASRSGFLPWQNTGLSQAAVMDSAGRQSVKTDSAQGTKVLIQKKIHISDLDRFLDMWR